MRKLLIKSQARLDLLDIWNHIAEENIEAAVRVVDQIETAIRSIAEMPNKGHQRLDIKDRRIRVWSVFSYLIAYRFDANTVTVVRVVHGRRNFRKLFRRKT